jgi:hypothetical protein
MAARRIEQRHVGIGLAHQQLDLGAAEDRALHAARDEAGDDRAIVGASSLDKVPEAQLVIDHTMHAFAVVRAGHEHGDAGGFYPLAVERMLHREARAEQRDATKVGGADMQS